MNKNINILAKSIVCIFLAAILTNCSSEQNQMLNKAWKYESYTDSLDLSKPPEPPDLLPSSISQKVYPIQKYAMLMKCIIRGKKGEDTYLKFEDDFNSSEKDVAKFKVYEKENQPLLTGKIRIWNDLDKISATYDGLPQFSSSDDFEIISITKNKLLLRFDDGGMMVTAVFIQ